MINRDRELSNNSLDAGRASKR